MSQSMNRNVLTMRKRIINPSRARSMTKYSGLQSGFSMVPSGTTAEDRILSRKKMSATAGLDGFEKVQEAGSYNRV